MRFCCLASLRVLVPSTARELRSNPTFTANRGPRSGKNCIFRAQTSHRKQLASKLIGFIHGLYQTGHHRLHRAASHRALQDAVGFRWIHEQWIAGWIGAWLGSPVLGHWGPSVNHVYVIPALLGAFIGAFAVTSMPRAASKAAMTKLQQNPTAPLELKKAS